MARIPIPLLQGFVTAARLGNLSRAADVLHVTVSALSHQIRQLEERIGRKVFERGPRGVTLTAEGQRLFDAVAPPLQRLDQALARFQVPCHDQLTLSALGSFASGWLVPRLPRFVQRFPELQLTLQSDVALVDFDRDAVDAALRFGPGGWPGVNAVHLFDEWVAPVAAPSVIERMGRFELSRIGDWPLLGDPSDRWREWFATFGGTPPARYVAHFDDTDALQRAAAAGMGVALGRLTMVRPLVESGRLRYLTGERLKAEWSHWLVWPPRADAHAGLVAFREWVVEEAREHVAALQEAAA